MSKYIRRDMMTKQSVYCKDIISKGRQIKINQVKTV